MPSTSEAVSFPGSSARSATHTRAPSSAKRRTVSRPMPPAPPVTTATFPSRRPGISVLLRGQVDVLYLRIVVEGVRTELASDAGLLEAAEGGGDPYRRVGVDGDHTCLHATGYAQGAGAVLGPDRTREAVLCVVGLPYGVFFVLERYDGDDGTEDLFSCHLIVVRDRGENDRRIPEPGALRRLAPDRHGRVFGDVCGDSLAVVGGDQRSHLRLLVKRVPDPETLYHGLHEREELVEGAFLDQDARASAAILPGVTEDGDGRRSGGLLQVGVGEDHVRGLAAQLQGDALYGACGSCHNTLADLRRTSEGDLGDVRVLDEPLPDLSPRTDDDVDDTLGNTCFEGYALELQGTQRRELRRLEDERVARREGRGHFPARYGERKVPRDDQAYDAEWFAERHVDATSDRNGVAEQALGHPCVVVEGLSYHRHLAAGIAYGLAGVLRLQLRQVLLFRVEGVGETPEQARAVVGWHISPRREGFPGAGDGRICVAFGGGFEALYHLFGRRVQDFEHLRDLRN